MSLIATVQPCCSWCVLAVGARHPQMQGPVMKINYPKDNLCSFTTTVCPPYPPSLEAQIFILQGFQFRLQENQTKEKLLEEEKKTVYEQAEELKESIKDLEAQKQVTEMELKEEIFARLAAEKRLQNAEETLSRLEKIIDQQGIDGKDFEECKIEMMGDVKHLKGFFENLSTEAKLDSEKSVMVKNTIHARKSLVKRAKTMKFESMKKQRKLRSRANRAESYNALDSVMLSSSSAAQVTVTMTVIPSAPA